MGTKGYIATGDGRTFAIGTNEEEVKNVVGATKAAPLHCSTMQQIDKYVDMLLRTTACDVILTDKKDNGNGNA